MARRKGRRAFALAAGAVVGLGLLVVLAPARPGAALQELRQVLVVNLREPHPVEGDVTVRAPVPHARLVRFDDVVAPPVPRSETSLWAEAGVVDTAGFTRLVLSLHGQLKGTPSAPGVVAAVLVPDEEEILRSLLEGEIHLALEATAEATGAGLYLSGSAADLPVGFPRYRLYVYNTTDRSASVDVFAYLTN